MPMLNVIARTGFSSMQPGLILEDADPRVRAMVWCGIAIMLGVSRFGCLAYS